MALTSEMTMGNAGSNQGVLKLIAALLALLPVLLSAPATRAQCPTAGWRPAFNPPGTNGQVAVTTMWDPDGVGPQTPVLVVGGFFSMAGGAHINGIATY